MGKLVDQYIEIAKKRNPGEPQCRKSELLLRVSY